MSNKEKKIPYDEALKQLEELVEKMEQSDLPLEKSLKYFEEGSRLLKYCEKTLQQAERKIEMLTRVTEEDGAEFQSFDEVYEKDEKDSEEEEFF